MENDGINLEKKFNRLDEILKKLESGECSMNESIELFSEGKKLIKELNTTIKESKTKVVEIIESTKED